MTLSEISQTGKGKYCMMSLMLKFEKQNQPKEQRKKPKSQIQKTDWCLLEKGCDGCVMGEDIQKVQTSCYKIHKFLRKRMCAHIYIYLCHFAVQRNGQNIVNQL